MWVAASIFASFVSALSTASCGNFLGLRPAKTLSVSLSAKLFIMLDVTASRYYPQISLELLVAQHIVKFSRLSPRTITYKHPPGNVLLPFPFPRYCHFVSYCSLYCQVVAEFDNARVSVQPRPCVRDISIADLLRVDSARLESRMW